MKSTPTASRGSAPGDPALVWFVWLLFVVEGLFYVIFIPPWEGFDEPIHLAYVDFLLENGRLPTFGESVVSDEIERSVESLPVCHSLLPFSPLRYENFYTPSRPSIPAHPVGSIPLYEAQQPPLYYLIMLGPYHCMESKSILARMYAVRAASLLLASLFVFPAYGFF